MKPLRVGQRVKLKATARRLRNPYAEFGTVRAVSFDDIEGEGRMSVYEVACYDDQGRHTVEFLYRSDVTLVRP